MRKEDISAALKASGTGLWLWDNARGLITLDARAASLLGLPAKTVTTKAPVARDRIHVEDFIALRDVVLLSAAEDRVAEAELRVMAPDGSVERTLRARIRPPQGAKRPEHPTDPFVVAGSLTEVPDTSRLSLPALGGWQRAREAFLLDAGRELAEARSTNEVLEVSARLAMPGFSPAGQAVFSLDGENVAIVGHHGQDPAEVSAHFPVPARGDYPAAQVIRTGRPVYLGSPAEYRDRFPGSWKGLPHFGRQSWAFLPLTVAGRTIGAWMASFVRPSEFTADVRSVLTTISRMLAQALSRAFLHDAERKLTADLEHTMRPSPAPHVPGVRIAGRYVPGSGGLQVGGDWYDVITLPSDRIALIIGDVQGHDVRAAALMAQLRIALRAYASEGHRPDAVLSRTSRFLADLTAQEAEGSAGLRKSAGSAGNLRATEATGSTVSTGNGGRGGEEGPAGREPRFATCLYVEADPHTGILDIARAGHPDLALLPDDGTLLVRPTEGGLPLGIDPGSGYPTNRLVLQPGETLLLCTDGLIETGGHDLDTGWRRLGEATRRLAGMASAGLETLAETLIGAVQSPAPRHPGPLTDRRQDDIALLLLRRHGPVPGARPPGTAGPAVRRAALTLAQAEPARVAQARRQLADMLHDWTEEERVDAAVLMLSEMLTNVLTHTEGEAHMDAELLGDPEERVLRVMVTDASDALPQRREPGEMASAGRGLLLMEALADSWGVHPSGQGKTIWYELNEHVLL